MKSMQNQNVSKTNGENKNFEGRMAAKSEIVKIHWKYVSFLTTPNRHVRQTIGIMQRAQRSKIEEIRLKWELLKYIGKMCHFWQAGAETMENVMFGEHSEAAARRWEKQQHVLEGIEIPGRL